MKCVPPTEGLGSPTGVWIFPTHRWVLHRKVRFPPSKKCSFTERYINPQEEFLHRNLRFAPRKVLLPWEDGSPKGRCVPQRKICSLTGRCVFPTGSCLTLWKVMFSHKKLFFPDKKNDYHTGRCVHPLGPLSPRKMNFPPERWISLTGSCVHSQECVFPTKKDVLPHRRVHFLHRKWIFPTKRYVSGTG